MTARYQIARRAGRCACKKIPFQDNEEIVTVLSPAEENFERRDLCLSCFAKEKSRIGKGSAFWRSQVSTKQRKNKQAEEFLQLLRLYSEEGSEPATTYLLCLFLERQKVLVKREEKRGEIFFECPETGEVFVAKRAHLAKEHLALFT